MAPDAAPHCPQGYYRSSPLIFACDGGRAEVEIYHLPGQTSMVELPRGLEDFSLHVVTSNALTSTELMKLYDPELNKFLVSHRDGSVNDEETEGHLGNLTLVYSGEMPMEWLEVWRRSLRNTFRALSDWGDELERRHGASITSARQAVEQHRSLISQASRIGGELSSAAVKLVEEATGRGEGDEPAEAYFEASAHAHAASAASGRGGHASEGQEDVSPESSDLWEEVSAAQAELQCHHELRKGRKAALVAQDEQLRQLRSEVVALRGQIQEAVERRDATRARAEAAERGLEVLQEAQHELQKLRNEHAAELRQLQVAAQQALQSERAWRARAAEGSWAREGPEIEALKAAKVELAELLAEADEVRLASKQASAQLTHQLEGAQAEHARLGGTRATPVAQVKGRLPTQLLLLLRCHSGSPGYSETKLRYSYTGAAPCASPAPQGCAGLNTSEALEALDAWRAWAHARYGTDENSSQRAWTELVAPLAKQGLLPWSRFEAFWGHMPEAPRWQPAAHLLDHNRDHCLSRREFDHAFGGHTRLPRVRGVRVGGWEEMQLLTAAWVTLTLCACWLVICRLQISRGREPAYAPVPSVEDLPPNPPEKVELPEKAAERWIAAGELPPAPDHTHLLDHPAPPPRKRWLNEHPPGTFGSLLAQSREKGDQK
ncbi:unnamed protein product [Durusdinium trenchii]|uniref:EF-hand domain-containing protein n=1 Tax=Durusdinium trenchii TaxID=1381693 RepID=A0ABP0IS24_9DINO